MRVFHLCAGAAQGGAETAFVDLAIAQHQAGFEVTPVCRPHPAMVKRLREAGLTPVLLPFGGVLDFKTRGALRRLIEERRPQIVQTWMNRAALFCPRPTKDAPFVRVARLGGYYKLKYYKGTDHFVTNTPDIRRYLIGKGVPDDKITHINNFADIADEPPFPRAELDTPEDAFICLTLSRLHPVKGIDVFLRALAQLPPHVYGWIAGEGPDAAKLEALAKELGVTDRVRFLGWRTDRTSLMRTSDCLVFPSRFEPFGNSFAQAWGAGCPLVTTESEGPMQYVQDGQDALVTPIDDVAALTKAIQRLIDDPLLGERLAKAGLERFESAFTREACVARYRALYQSLTTH